MYTAPDLCVNPGLNPNTFEQYVTVSDNTFLLLTLILVIGGVALGVFFSVFLRCISGMATRERAFSSHSSRFDQSRSSKKRPPQFGIIGRSLVRGHCRLMALTGL
uniref:Transmembrane protein n=1 Tax=Globodera pallida TaxID=36090 RepID=A0A183CAY3_GLOPA